jgi:hypothetical protein
MLLADIHRAMSESSEVRKEPSENIFTQTTTSDAFGNDSVVSDLRGDIKMLTALIRRKEVEVQVQVLALKGKKMVAVIFNVTDGVHALSSRGYG